MAQQFKLFLLVLLCVVVATEARRYTQPRMGQRATYNFVYGGGNILSNVKLYHIYWSSDVGPVTTLDDFGKSLVGSTYVTSLSEYSTGNYNIGAGTWLGSHQLNSVQTNLSAAIVSAELDNLIGAGTIPAPDSNTLYQIFIASNSTVFWESDKATDYTCGPGPDGFCGIHKSWKPATGTLNEAYYAINADCASGCGNTTFTSFTSTAAHELVEAITDPGAATTAGWTDPVGGEIADVCESVDYTSNVDGKQWVVTQWWSNKAVACVTVGPGGGGGNSPASTLSSFLFDAVSFLF